MEPDVGASPIPPAGRVSGVIGEGALRVCVVDVGLDLGLGADVGVVVDVVVGTAREGSGR